VRIGLACEAGRPRAEILDLLEAAGLPVASLREERAPALLEPPPGAWLLGTSGDVLRACDRGALDVGVVGSDGLLEGRFGVADLLDLGLCRDELVLAMMPGGGRPDRRPRIATRYPETTSRHFAAAGAQPDILVLDEPSLAPALGLADGVVELRSRLTAGLPGMPPLEIGEVVAAVSAHLVAARAARVLLRDEIGVLVTSLRAALEER
jgi:ATP phosphoribosyltransferase